MLRSLTENANNMQEHMQKDGNSKKESKRNAQNQIIVIKMKTAFDRFISKRDTEEERIHEHGKVSIETSNTEM